MYSDGQEIKEKILESDVSDFFFTPQEARKRTKNLLENWRRKKKRNREEKDSEDSGNDKRRLRIGLHVTYGDKSGVVQDIKRNKVLVLNCYGRRSRILKRNIHLAKKRKRK